MHTCVASAKAAQHPTHRERSGPPNSAQSFESSASYVRLAGYRPRASVSLLARSAEIASRSLAMRTVIPRAAILLPVLLAALSSCKKDREPGPSGGSALVSPSGAVAPVLAPNAPAANLPAAGTLPSALPLGVTWADPTGWQRLPLQNPMRKATYRVPRATGDKEDGELAVFYFGPSEGGGLEANVQRWIKQFQDVPAEKVRRAERTQNGLRQHTLEIDSGTFSSGMPGGPTQPKAGYGLLGGIVEAPSGAYFFKLTGPSATVQAARPGFTALLDSVKVSQ
ncbi:MAG TPA: hypothetical protein VFQ61_07850 [Polyangiaceae bacterium]|nr:hypothetical protein [Polyangiaceae bacterium]